jgi:hypothetical protein
MNKHSLQSFISTITFLAVLFFLSVSNTANMYRVNNGATVLINEHGVNKNVANACGVDRMVPTLTAGEWTNFRNNKPACMTLSDPAAPCNLPWGGSIASGQGVTAYQYATSASCAFYSETRTCTNGSLSGTYTNASCSPPAGGTWQNPITESCWDFYQNNCVPSNDCGYTNPAGQPCSPYGAGCMKATTNMFTTYECL